MSNTMFLSYLVYLEKASLEDKLEILKKKFFDYAIANKFYIFTIKDTPERKNYYHNRLWKIIVSSDPTKNKQYLQWIIQHAIPNDVAYWKGKNIPGWIEDSYNIEESLTLFDEYKRKNKLPPNKKDINKFSGLGELQVFLEDLKDSLEKQSEAQIVDKEQSFFKSKQAEIFYESSRIRVIIPRTHEASCFFGRKTNWCTAVSKPDFYEDYTVDGPLYIIEDKKNDTKYQFHFESNQFMDSRDKYIEWRKIYKDKQFIKELQTAFSKQAKKESYVPLIDNPNEAEIIYYAYTGFNESIFIRLENIIYNPFIKLNAKTRNRMFEILFLQDQNYSGNILRIPEEPRYVGIIEKLFKTTLPYPNRRFEIAELIIKAFRYPDSTRQTIWKLYNRSYNSVPEDIKVAFEKKFKVNFVIDGPPRRIIARAPIKST